MAVQTCRLCDNPASYVGWDGDPELPASHPWGGARRIMVCGLHMVSGDELITESN